MGSSGLSWGKSIWFYTAEQEAQRLNCAFVTEYVALSKTFEKWVARYKKLSLGGKARPSCVLTIPPTLTSLGRRSSSGDSDVR